MQAVISVLDEVYCQVMARLWEELEQGFQVRATKERVPFPHLSYQRATSYDPDRLRAALQGIEQKVEPFEIETGGIGIIEDAVSP